MHHIACIRKGVDTKKYDNFIVLGDVNCEASNDCMKDFCEAFNSSSLVKKPTCFKNPENPTCIDSILTNRSIAFKILLLWKLESSISINSCLLL